MPDEREEYNVEIDQDYWTTMLLDEPTDWPNPYSPITPVDGPDVIPPDAVTKDGLVVTVTAPTFNNRAKITWGDATAATTYVSPASHTYATAGTYTITMDPNTLGEPDVTTSVTVTSVGGE